MMLMSVVVRERHSSVACHFFISICARMIMIIFLFCDLLLEIDEGEVEEGS